MGGHHYGSLVVLGLLVLLGVLIGVGSYALANPLWPTQASAVMSDNSLVVETLGYKPIGPGAKYVYLLEFTKNDYHYVVAVGDKCITVLDKTPVNKKEDHDGTRQD